MMKKQSSGGGDDVGGDGGSWCVWFMCCVFIVSSAIVLLVTAAASTASAPFRLPSISIPHAATATPKSESRGHYSIQIADNVTSAAVVDLKNNIISAAAIHNDHPSNSSSSSSSSPVLKLPSPNNILVSSLHPIDSNLLFVKRMFFMNVECNGVDRFVNNYVCSVTLISYFNQT